MKKTLLITAVLISATSFSQKKLIANSAYNLDESGALMYLDSASNSYADYQGSVLTVGPTFGMGQNASPLMWNWNTPDVPYSTSDLFQDLMPVGTNTKVFNGSHLVTSNTSSNGYRTTYIYTGAGKISSFRFEVDMGGGTWTPNYGMDYFYDGSERLIFQNRLDFSSGSGVIVESDTIGYVGTTNNINRVATYSSTDGITFDAQDLMVYTYSGNNPATLNYSTDDDGDPMTPLVWLVAVNYNYSGGNLTSFVGYLVAAGVITPTEAIHIDYTYDGSNRLLSLNQTGMFGLQGQNFVYDTEGFATRVSSFEETMGGGSLYLSRDEFFYYQNTASIEEVNSVEFTAYPNPANDIVTISTNGKINELVVYTMDGKKMISQKGGDSINISNLTQGNYILVVETANGSARKMISKN